MFTVQETAARREAEQLRVSQSRLTETVEVTAASWEADRLRRTSRARAEETAGEAAARREEDQHQTAAARGGEGLDPVDNVGAFTSIVVVIFVQCIVCSGWAFCVMGCCPQISPCLYHLRLDYERIFILL